LYLLNSRILAQKIEIRKSKFENENLLALEMINLWQVVFDKNEFDLDENLPI
jgi:hypothetical protein